MSNIVGLIELVAASGSSLSEALREPYACHRATLTDADPLYT